MCDSKLEEWKYGALGLVDPYKQGKFSALFDQIQKNHREIDGDYVEFGVYNGASLLAMALYLKDIGSPKKVYGFDTFSGFPASGLSEVDHFRQFKRMKDRNQISEDHYRDALELKKMNELLASKTLDDVREISSSGNFSNVDLATLERKIELLKLDNVVLVKGEFSELRGNEMPSKIFAANLDCDLFSSCSDALGLIWPRLSVGGMIWVDEYYSLKFPGARLATDAFVSAVGDGCQLKCLEFSNNRRAFERWALFREG